MNSLVTNEQFKSRLVRHMRKVIDLLGDPTCELFQSLVIDYDLIEVNDGICWSVRRRAFVKIPIEARQIGKPSPRCFCAYDPSKKADPTYFREILENSLSASEVATFCDDFLKLFNYNAKKHKDRVPSVVAAANSGKPSLFFPIQGLVHRGNIAPVTKQCAFNKAMITPFTEVIFIDEADESVLDISDWKILTQGDTRPRHQIPNRKTIHEQMPHANNGTAQVGLRCHSSTSHGQMPANVSFQEPSKSEKRGSSLAVKARHGMRCVGSQESK